MKVHELLDVFNLEDLTFIPADGYENYKGSLKPKDLLNAEIIEGKVLPGVDKVKVEIYFRQNDK